MKGLCWVHIWTIKCGALSQATESEIQGNAFVSASPARQRGNVSIQEAPVEFNQARQTRLKALKSHGRAATPCSQYPIQNWIFCSVARCLSRWKAGGRGDGGVEFFESLNLYGLLRYQAPWTRSDADTFVEGWQISCPSRCLIAWPLFTKWWRWQWGRMGGAAGAGKGGVDSSRWCRCEWEGPHMGHQQLTVHVKIHNKRRIKSNKSVFTRFRYLNIRHNHSQLSLSEQQQQCSTATVRKRLHEEGANVPDGPWRVMRQFHTEHTWHTWESLDMWTAFCCPLLDRSHWGTDTLPAQGRCLVPGWALPQQWLAERCWVPSASHSWSVSYFWGMKVLLLLISQVLTD